MLWSGCLRWGEGKGRGKQGLKGVDFKNTFRKLWALWTWTILGMSLGWVRAETRSCQMATGTP